MKEMILKGLLQSVLWGLIAMFASYLWWNSHTLLSPVTPVTESIPIGIGVGVVMFVMSVLGARKNK